MSFFSAEANPPGLADLAGLLCGPGQTALFAKGTARLSLVLEDSWRAKALVGACAERGVTAEVRTCETTGRPLLTTAFRADLAPLAARWTRDGAKVVPEGFTPDGAALRMWVLAAGHRLDNGYLLALDPDAPHTHLPLVSALARCGLPVAEHAGERGPGLRVTGRRRLARLVELVGPPAGPGCADQWPAAARMRVVS